MHNSQCISLSDSDISSPRALGRKEITPICQKQYNMSPQEVLQSTPKSQLVQKPSSAECHTKKRKLVREVKQAIQSEMDRTDVDNVMSNRISWSAFDRMRKEEGLCTEKLTHKRRAQEDTEDTPKPKKRHGCTLEGIDKGNLIQEAQSWSPDEIVNWTALAKRYGVTTPNGGQSLKEFLQQHNVPAAFINQKENRTPRRKRKQFPGGVTFPMHRPVNIQKEVLQQRVETGEILLGEEIVETYYTRFTVDKSTKSVRESTASVHARKIGLMDIRKKLLDKHEKMGLLREKSLRG